MKPRILIIDDDPEFLEIIRWMLEQHGHRADCCRTFDEGLQHISDSPPDAVLLDWRLNDKDGLELIQPIRQRVPHLPVILITADPSVELAIRSIKAGAFDFLPKPLDEARLTMTLSKAVEHHRLLQQVWQLDTAAGFEEMIGSSPQMRTVYHIIANVAQTDVSVMICGESGTGKELVARAIHRRSRRHAGPFVALNMAGLPRELVESTLFGHEKGAFTGADRQRIGACEEARGGTLFLDEIGEMPLELQPKLLRFLQERVFRHIGGSADIPSDTRIISATNREPLAEVQAGRLRADLFYRLNVVPILLPPLRQRAGDIPLLATWALGKSAERYGKSFRDIDDQAMRRFCEFDWPGNVRQLVHAIERIVVLNDAPVLTLSMLDGFEGFRVEEGDRAQGTGNRETRVSPVASALSPDSEIIPLDELERRAIQSALTICRGAAAEAARRLRISNATIYRKIKEYNLTGSATAVAPPAEEKLASST